MKFKQKMTDIKAKVKNRKEQAGAKATVVKRKTQKGLMIVGVVAIAIAGTSIWSGIRHFTNNHKEMITHEAEVTNITIEHKLQEIGEMATYDYTYTDVTTIKDTRKLFDKVDIPGTTHSMDMKYSGVIKVGYEVSDIKTRVAGEKIIVKLPEVQMLDNYINDEDVEFLNKNNNVLNPIEPEEGYKYLSDEKQRQLTIAEEEGIYDLAEENAQNIISDLLSVYDDYEVEFI